MIEAFPFDSGPFGPAATRSAAPTDSNDLYPLEWAELTARFAIVQELRRSMLVSAPKAPKGQTGSFARLGRNSEEWENPNKIGLAVNLTDLADVKCNEVEPVNHEADFGGDGQVMIESKDD